MRSVTSRLWVCQREIYPLNMADTHCFWSRIRVRTRVRIWHLLSSLVKKFFGLLRVACVFQRKKKNTQKEAHRKTDHRSNKKVEMDLMNWTSIKRSTSRASPDFSKNPNLIWLIDVWFTSNLATRKLFHKTLRPNWDLQKLKEQSICKHKVAGKGFSSALLLQINDSFVFTG